MGFKSMLAERAKQWPKEWMEEGRQKGRREGRRAGQAHLLVLLLEQKFGSLPKSFRRQVDSADADTLMEWAGRVLASDDLEQVFNGHFAPG